MASLQKMSRDGRNLYRVNYTEEGGGGVGGQRGTMGEIKSLVLVIRGDDGKHVPFLEVVIWAWVKKKNIQYVPACWRKNLHAVLREESRVVNSSLTPVVSFL